MKRDEPTPETMDAVRAASAELARALPPRLHLPHLPGVPVPEMSEWKEPVIIKLEIPRRTMAQVMEMTGVDLQRALDAMAGVAAASVRDTIERKVREYQQRPRR